MRLVAEFFDIIVVDKNRKEIGHIMTNDFPTEEEIADAVDQMDGSGAYVLKFYDRVPFK